MNFTQAYHDIASNAGYTLSQPIPKNSDVIIFGYGDLGRDFAKSNRKNCDFNIIAFIDNKHSGFCPLENIPIIKPDEISRYPNSVIWIGTLKAHYKEQMEKELKSLGIDEKRIFNKQPSFTTTTTTFEEKYLKGYENTYNLLNDEISKDVLLQRIASYFDDHIFKPSPFKDQYFSADCISFTDQEVFVNADAVS